MVKAITANNGRGASPDSTPSNDERPNSGMREGDISHADVNAALKSVPKTVIFGQQNRLRDGFLMDDEKLTRFHAGHELVRFFYQGLNKLPDYLLDALLESNISVTLVTEKDLLVFRDARNHQSFHVGYTRKTIYMPEGVIQEAINKGYDSWAISEVLIREGWPLLDYLLIVEFVRRAKRRLRTHYSLGSPEGVKNVLRRINKHRMELENTDDNEFKHFYVHYCNGLYTLTRSSLDTDTYHLADAIFDEAQERAWADVKLNQITNTFEYPTLFDVDRDIVHQAAFRAARARKLPVEPQTTEDLLHDLWDAARFRTLRQTKTDNLFDQLLERGADGITGFLKIAAGENASGHHVVTADYHDGYDAVAEFKAKLLAFSNTLPEGGLGSICNDFRDLLSYRTFREADALFQKFTALPIKEQSANKFYIRKLIDRILGSVNLPDPMAQAQLATSVAKTKSLQTLLSTAQSLLKAEDPELERRQLLSILRKMDRHPAYHTLLLTQARRLSGDSTLSFGKDIREVVDALYRLIPDQPYRLSSDPNRLRTCLDNYQRMRRATPNNERMFSLLAGVLIRLDRADNYGDLVEHVRHIGPPAKPGLEDAVGKINRNDPARQAILQHAQALLASL